jgi:hypothetical protein
MSNRRAGRGASVPRLKICENHSKHSAAVTQKRSLDSNESEAPMSRDIHVYAIAHDQPDGYFLVREKGRPDHRLEIPKDRSLFDTIKAIATAHAADSMHIQLTNDPTVEAQVEINAHLPLDEAKPVRWPTSN